MIRVERQFQGTLLMQEEANYTCQSCGEAIVVPVDISAGDLQSYVEDCPVCCRANVIRIEIDFEGRIWASSDLE
ncbi:MAG: CPXCG motif-containing cysteine-rich protein [Pirellulales bacterium]|nr:CPXCG motif-containing cysteine-rich protein [Pirellulales bacterium]